MTKVTNAYGQELDYDAIVELMNEDLREEVHAELAPCEPQEFYDAYCELFERKYGAESALASYNLQY